MKEPLDTQVIEDDNGWFYIICEGQKLISPYRTREAAEEAVKHLTLLLESTYPYPERQPLNG